MQFHSDKNDYVADLKNGLVYAVQHALTTKNGRVLLYTTRKDSLDPGNAVHDVVQEFLALFGPTFFNILKRDRMVKLCDELTIYWETTGMARKHAIGRNFIAFGAIVTPTDMQTIISDHRTVDSVYAPFLPTDLPAYLTLYSASQPI